MWGKRWRLYTEHFLDLQFFSTYRLILFLWQALWIDRERILILSHVCMWKSVSHVQLLGTPWTVAHQASLSRGFSRQEYWSGSLRPPPGDRTQDRICRKILYCLSQQESPRRTRCRASKGCFQSVPGSCWWHWGASAGLLAFCSFFSVAIGTLCPCVPAFFPPLQTWIGMHVQRWKLAIRSLQA